MHMPNPAHTTSTASTAYTHHTTYITSLPATDQSSQSSSSLALANKPYVSKMDTIIDLSDSSKALDLANIRFQLMCAQANIGSPFLPLYD